MSMLNRRALAGAALGGLVAVPTVAQVPELAEARRQGRGAASRDLTAHTQAQRIGPNDRRLMELERARQQADADNNAALGRASQFELDKTPAGSAGYSLHQAASDEAVEREKAALMAMAATPADGFLGLCVKAALALRVAHDGPWDPEIPVLDSLEADIARMAPEMREMMA